MSDQPTINSSKPDEQTEEGSTAPDNALADDLAAQVFWSSTVFVVGGYTVGDGGDGQLGGHPDIRY